ncbi:MAG: porin [Desulforhopalus sp.]
MSFLRNLRTVLIVCILSTGTSVYGGYEFQLGDQVKGEIGFWAQTWYQYVEDGKDSNNDGIRDNDLNDFMIRRAYFSIRGEATRYLDFFTHIASDRIGQEGLDDSSNGLGSGVAFRDLWITLKPHETLKIQVGRMYVPFTRNYGTTSTMSLLTTDLDWAQGGIRSNIFYPNKVGRDDGATLWGNIGGGLIQYRFMLGEGEESSRNPDDNLRFAGRISASLFEPETGWFNQGTYMGKKRVLSLGAGIDSQNDLLLANEEEDYFSWTVDVFYDQPLGSYGALTFEGAYIDIENGPNPITYTQQASGDDASIISLKAGYLMPGNIGPGQFQPFVHFQQISVDESGKDDTNVYGAGLNYFFKGHANKISLDFTFVDQEEEIPIQDVQDHFIITLQLAAGF